MAGPVTVPLGPAVAHLVGVRAGDRNLLHVRITSAGVPLDLTGSTVTAQARKKSTDAVPAITADVEVTDAALGEIDLRWPGEQVTAALAGADTWAGVWDLQVQAGADDPVTICAGKPPPR